MPLLDQLTQQPQLGRNVGPLLDQLSPLLVDDLLQLRRPGANQLQLGFELHPLAFNRRQTAARFFIDRLSVALDSHR